MNNLLVSVGFLLIIVNTISCQESKGRPEFVILKYKSNATFDCSRLKDPVFYQSKAGVERKYEGNEKNVKIDDNKLTLFDLRGEEIQADYLCRNKDDDSKKIEFIKRIAPYLYKPDKLSQTVSEGNKAEFKCSVLYGNEQKIKVDWEWRKNDTALSDIEGKLTITSNENETSLVISNVVEADKGEYECHVKNLYGQHSERIQLRVKDAFAALWPFLAIVAEVLILCVILLVYEKKCSKKRNSAEDETEQTQNLMGRDGNSDLKKRTVKA